MKQGGAVASLQSLKSGLQNVKAAMPSAVGEPYLRMLRDGTWVYGQNNTEVEEGSAWAINPLSIQHGWVCWTRYDENSGKKNEKLAEVMVPCTQMIPSYDELPEHEFPWTKQISFQLRCMDGEDEGTQVQYSGTSVGGMNAVSALLEEIIKRIDETDDIVPVVELNSSHYQHKKYGKTYVPQLDVVEWVSLDGMPDEEIDEEEAAPPARSKAARKSAPVAASDEAPPVKRTRGKAAAPKTQKPAVATATRRNSQSARSSEPEEAAPVRRRRR